MASDPGFRFKGTLAVIGGGRMGEAIVRGLLGSETVECARVCVAEPVAARREELEAAHGVATVAEATGLPYADVVLIAVKPQQMDDVVRAASGSLGESLVVSIAAGVSCARLESLLPDGTAVVRVMPNTPAMVGEGMSVISGGSSADEAQVELVRALFAQIGEAVIVDERYQDAATAISGSGPAYFALVVDAIARAGVGQGLPRSLAQQLAVQTMRGTAELISATGTHPEALVDAVTSPGGTTIAALEALEARGVRSAFAEAVAAAVARAKELG
jgi:pyrroline-5-carboxylate reductase